MLARIESSLTASTAHPWETVLTRAKITVPVINNQVRKLAICSLCPISPSSVGVARILCVQCIWPAVLTGDNAFRQRRPIWIDLTG